MHYTLKEAVGIVEAMMNAEDPEDEYRVAFDIMGQPYTLVFTPGRDMGEMRYGRNKINCKIYAAPPTQISGISSERDDVWSPTDSAYRLFWLTFTSVAGSAVDSQFGSGVPPALAANFELSEGEPEWVNRSSPHGPIEVDFMGCTLRYTSEHKSLEGMQTNEEVSGSICNQLELVDEGGEHHLIERSYSDNAATFRRAMTGLMNDNALRPLIPHAGRLMVYE